MVYPENILENNAKLKAEKTYYGNQASCPAEPLPVDMCGAVQGQISAGIGGYSLRDEAQKRSNHHSQEAAKAAVAANFFHLHPEFEEFIRLILSGSIQL
jgi:hypothetical protein